MNVIEIILLILAVLTLGMVARAKQPASAFLMMVFCFVLIASLLGNCSPLPCLQGAESPSDVTYRTLSISSLLGEAIGKLSAVRYASTLSGKQGRVDEAILLLREVQRKVDKGQVLP